MAEDGTARSSGVIGAGQMLRLIRDGEAVTPADLGGEPLAELSQDLDIGLGPE